MRHNDRLQDRLQDPVFRAEYLRVLREQQKAGVPTPREKIAMEKRDAELTLKAEVRDPKCWRHDCDRDAGMWVREVQFDLKEDKAEHNQVLVSTDDYGGPVPGFCRFHDAIGPAELAEAVYHERPEFKFGAPARRWFVIFTDGTKLGGRIEALDLGPGFKVVDEHIRAH